MSSAARRKGSQFERDVVAVLRAHGFPHAERAYRLGVHDDRGDVDGCVGFLIECKNHARHDLAGWVDATVLKAEKHRACPVVVVKRVKRPIERAYVVMELATFAMLAAKGDT